MKEIIHKVCVGLFMIGTIVVQYTLTERIKKLENRPQVVSVTSNQPAEEFHVYNNVIHDNPTSELGILMSTMTFKKYKECHIDTMFLHSEGTNSITVGCQ